MKETSWWRNATQSDSVNTYSRYMKFKGLMRVHVGVGESTEAPETKIMTLFVG